MSRRIETLEFRNQALGHTIETLSDSGEMQSTEHGMGETKIKSVSCQVRAPAQPRLSHHRHPRSEAAVKFNSSITTLHSLPPLFTT